VTWTAPAIERDELAYVGDERTILESYLDWHRQTLLLKCAALTADQLKQASVEPSNLTLLGLVRHMSEVERSWFQRRVAGRDIDWIYCTDASEDGDFDDVADADAEADFARFHTEVEAARQAAAGVPLEFTFVGRRQHDISLRWVYAHMIEEYARHNGHADLIRERIDGTTGD